jgi:glycosyltransferase involved in cell wall biosynthesis
VAPRADRLQAQDQPNAASPISVTLAIGSDPYQQRLPMTLLRHGMLRRVLRFRPDPEVLDPNDAGSLEIVRRFRVFKVVNRIVWAGWRRLPGAGRAHLPKVATTWLADRLASRYVPPSSIFHGFLGVCLACSQAAKRQGAVTIVENPTLPLQHWQDEVMAECGHFSVDPRHCNAVLPPRLIKRAQREYEVCDKILVLSSVARRSFEQLGHGQKVVVVWPGVDHLFFTPSPASETSGFFRASYVGRVELAKGIGYLLQAWKSLELPDAELLLIGEIKPEMRTLLKRYAGANVRLTGALRPEEVAERYRQSSVFVFPSVNEGMGLVLLEAMASGLPVVASEKTGAQDCVTEGKDGFVVKARDADALAERILWCYEHRAETKAMGRAARTKVEQQFTLSHYEERQIALYQSLTSQVRAH